MVALLFLLAVVTATVSMALVWREGSRRMERREYYVSPLTLFRKELSLAGIATIATVVIWASYFSGLARLAAIAIYPTYLYIFLVLRRSAD